MWEDFEFDPDKVPHIKLGVHLGQILFGFISWCLEIVVFRGEGSLVNGHIGWTFAVFFLSIPAWIYLCMAPRFPRTRHLAEPHVMLVVDAVYMILWLSAFSTQAAYNTANLCGSVCGVSKAIVAMAFFVCLFFGITSFLSIYTLKYYQFNDRLPGYDRIQAKNQNIDPDKAAFSMAPHGEDAYAPVHGRDNDNDEEGGRHSYGGDQASAVGNAASQQRRPSYGSGHGSHDSSPYGHSRVSDPYAGQEENPFDQRRQDNNPFEDHVGYTPPPSHTPAPGGAPVLSSSAMYVPPAAHDEYDDGRPVQFPSANYDRAR